MKIISTKKLREDMAQIVRAVDQGESMILSLGRGKKATQIALNPLKKKRAKLTPANQGLREFLAYYKTRQVNIPDELKNYKDFKTFYKKTFLKLDDR